MANTIIKGDVLMLFDADGKSLAYATNHTLSLSGETTDISSKDHGVYGASEVNKITWEITSENLYTNEQYDALFDKMVARESITVFFGSKSLTGTGTVVDGDYPNWTKAAGCYTGKAFITSLNLNAPNKEVATFSLTLSGAGKIVKATDTSTGTSGSSSSSSSSNEPIGE